MKNIKNNKTILAVIPAVVVLAAGVAFFCSRSGNTDKQCQETVERLQKLETADISSIEDAIRALSEKEKPTGSDSEEGVLGDILTDVQIKQAFQGTVIVGDSITEYYPLDEFYDNLPTINSGRSGWVTDQILDNIDSLVYIYNPTKVFLLIGTNDIEQGKSINDIVNNIEKITKKIEKKRPKTKIYIESIYPINNTNSEKINHGMVGSRKNSTIKKINKEIKDYCNENDYTYIDVYNNLTDKNGNLKLEYTEVGLHLSSLGYIKVTKILYPYLGDTN